MRIEKNLEAVLELCRDPMLAVEQGKIVYANNAARVILPALFASGRDAERLPDGILFETSDRFVASVGLAGKQYTVSGAYYGGTRVLSLAVRAEAAKPGLVSDGMMVYMRSTLCNIGLAARRVSALTEESGNAALEHSIAILHHNYYALNRQLGNLDTALRMRDGNLYFSPRQVDLVTLCGDLAATVGALTREDWAVLTFSSSLPELVAWVDAVLVERLLLNLLSNSLAHTPKEGEIRLRLERSGDNAVLSVDDNGEGIPADVLQNIFARYECRLDCEHLDRATSAGLGLGIAGGIAKLHGGVLVIESREGKGSSVRAMLPLEQPRTHPLESGGPREALDMNDILTELSGLLGPEYYSPRYLD